MSIGHDVRNQPYVELDTIRITWIARDEDGWHGSSGYLRLQSYRGDPTEHRALHKGVELAIRSGWDLCALVAALTRLALFRPAVFACEQDMRTPSEPVRYGRGIVD